MKIVTQILLTAADIVEHIGWTQKTAARDGFGNPVYEISTSAVAYCAIGAIHSLNVPEREAETEARRHLNKFLGCSAIHWNDAPNQTAANAANTLRLAAEEFEAQS